MIGNGLTLLGSAVRQKGYLRPNPIFHMPLVEDDSIPIGVGVAAFTRASTGTYVDKDDGLVKTAAIDVGRFEKNGRLIEGASTNLLLRSEEFDNAAWSEARISVSPNAIIAPDGNMTADELIEDTDTGVHNVFQSTVLPADTHTDSIYAKANTRSWIKVSLATSGGAGVFFNVSEGTVGTADTGYTGRIEPAANGFFRCSITFTTTAANNFTIVRLATGDGTDSYTGDGTSGLYIWGAQLEQLPFASSYIPTTSATVTRAADNLSVDAANIPAPTADYSVAAQVDVLGFATSFPSVFEVEGESSRRLIIREPNEIRLQAPVTSSFFGFSENVVFGCAAVVNSTDQALYVDGLERDRDAAGVVSGAKTSISIGKRGSTQYLFGHIKNLRIYDIALTAEQVGAL